MFADHGVEGMDLAPVVERSRQILLPIELGGFAVPVLDPVASMFAVGSVLVTSLERTVFPVAEFPGQGTVAVPVVLLFVSASTFIAVAVRIEHIALGVLYAVAVVPEAVLDGNLVLVVRTPYVVQRNLEEVLHEVVAVMGIKKGTIGAVLHVSPLPIISPTGLEVKRKVMFPPVGVLPAGPTYIGTVPAPSLSVGKGGRLYSHHIGHLLLGEFTSSLQLLQGSSSVPVVPALPVIESSVNAPCPESAPGRGEKSAPLVGRRLLGRDVDNSGIPIRPVTSRRCGQDFDILHRSGRDLLESRSPFERARLTVDIDEESRTSTEAEIAVTVHKHRRKAGEDVYRSTTGGRNGR